MSLLSEASSSSQPVVLGTDIDIRMIEVMRDETKSLQLCREILRIWSKQNKVKYVPPAFRGSLKYKRWKVNYTGIYVDNPRPRIILNRAHWKSFATVTLWKLNLETLAHEFVHHIQFSRSGMKHENAFPAFEFTKEHCKRKYEGEAKETSRMMIDQIVHRIESGEISLLPRDGVFGEAGIWAAELLRAHARGNPDGYRPYPWTKCELKYPEVQEKILSCVRHVPKLHLPELEGKPGLVSPFGLCRVSIKCPPQG